MDSAQTQLTEKLTAANNILVTVSRNPSVDQLAACIALTLLLNKLNKHTTAVFSGEVPSTIEFLQPEGTLEKNTDSLRDFIIALDKSKADKLRYKVEDQLVRIFITPYRTSISEKDLDFSQGDFNVDLVIALGVADQADLDAAITAHGRILHDATVSSINAAPNGALGSINWNDPAASSLCELVSVLAETLGKDLLDPQVSTALLTGIVAETVRFSNEKTTPATMSISSELLAAGADQQLVATKLQSATSPLGASINQGPAGDDNKSDDDNPDADDSSKSDDGTLNIDHKEETPEGSESDKNDEEKAKEEPEPVAEPKADEADKVVSEEPKIEPLLASPPEEERLPDEPPSGTDTGLPTAAEFAVEPPITDGPKEPNIEVKEPEPLVAPTDSLSLPSESAEPAPEPKAEPAPVAAIPEVVPPTEVPAPEEPPVAVQLPDVPEPLVNTFTPPPPSWTPPAPEAPVAPAPEPPTSSLPVAPEPTVISPTPQPEAPEEPLTIVPPSLPSESPTPPIIPSPMQTPIAPIAAEEVKEEPIVSPPQGAYLQTPDVNEARDEVMKALEDADAPTTLEPIQALNAQPLGAELHHETVVAPPPMPTLNLPTLDSAPAPATSFEQTLQQAIPAAPAPEVIPVPPPLTQVPDVTLPSLQLPQAVNSGAASPPPVPPPIPYRFGNSVDQAQS